jgi:hypothetical protein
MIKFPLLHIEPTEQTLKEKTIAKWKAIGMLDGLYDIKKQIIKFPLLKEKECYEPNIFDSIAFPIIRRAFAHTLSSELVPVQPMELPSGMIHYINYQYNRPESITVNITVTNNKLLKKKQMVKFPLLKEKKHYNIDFGGVFLPTIRRVFI